MTTNPAIFVSLALLFAPAPSHAQNLFEHMPGNRQHQIGNHAYDAGRYWKAMQNYRAAAYWADKISQYNIGVMYLNGEGRDSDPARAWAWFRLAAERQYPHMQQTAEEVWLALDFAQRDRALEIFEQELLPVYGDKVAVPRTAKRMQSNRRAMTGSRLGRSGSMTIVDRSTGLRSGDEFYNEDKWNFYYLVLREVELFRGELPGHVDFGEFIVIEPEEN